MKRMNNSNEQRLINDVRQKIQTALKGFIGIKFESESEAVDSIFQRLLCKVLDDVDEYEPIVGPELPRRNGGDEF